MRNVLEDEANPAYIDEVADLDPDWNEDDDIIDDFQAPLESDELNFTKICNSKDEAEAWIKSKQEQFPDHTYEESPYDIYEEEGKYFVCILMSRYVYPEPAKEILN